MKRIKKWKKNLKNRSLNKKSKEYKSKYKTSFEVKNTLGFMLLYLLPIILVLIFDKEFNIIRLEYMIALIYIYLGILLFFFSNKKQVIGQVLLFLFIIGIFIFLCYFWITSKPIGNFILEDTHINILLIFFLVFATIVNIFLFRRDSGIRRVPLIEYFLNNNLILNFKNQDRFIAKNSTMTLNLHKRNKKEKIEKSKDKAFRKRVFKAKDLFVGTIFPKGKSKSIKEYIEKEIKIKIKQEENNYGGLSYKYSPKKQKGEYLLYLSLTYESDIGEKAPYNVFSYYLITLDSKGFYNIGEV